jgi:hypothetical protein
VSADDARVIKANRKKRAVRRKIAVANAIQPGSEEQEQLYAGARQSEDPIIDQPTPVDEGAAVAAKVDLRAVDEEAIGRLESALNARVQSLRPPRTPQQFPFVADSDIDAHNAAVTQLNADIEDSATKGDDDGPIFIFWEREWKPYVAEWKQWVEEHTGTLSRFDDAGFARLRMRYEDLRVKWLKMGQQTNAPSQGPGTPPGSGPLDETAHAVGEAAKSLVTLAMVGGVLYVASQLLRGGRR